MEFDRFFPLRNLRHSFIPKKVHKMMHKTKKNDALLKIQSKRAKNGRFRENHSNRVPLIIHSIEFQKV